MTIVCLGWGSLVWNRGGPPLVTEGNEDGPAIPIEFARQSDNGRMTLVITSGSLRSSERAGRIEHIKALADGTDKLAEGAKDGSVQYQQFQEVLGALHAAGFLPAGDLVSNVAEGIGR
jgi:hypothetical protein